MEGKKEALMIPLLAKGHEMVTLNNAIFFNNKERERTENTSFGSGGKEKKWKSKC